MFQNNEGRHPATPTRLQTARSEGDVTKSFQLSSAIQLIAVLLVAWLFVQSISSSIETFARDVWTQPQINASQYNTTEHFKSAFRLLKSSLLPLLGMLFIFGVGSYLMQTGFMFLPQKVSLDFNRLSPIHWFQRLFSWSGLGAAILDLPKVVIVVFAAATSVYFNLEALLKLSSLSVEAMSQQMFGLILKIGFQTAMILFVFGLLDYGLAWRSRQQRLRMTDQQLRDELRQQGNTPAMRRRRS